MLRRPSWRVRPPRRVPCWRAAHFWADVLDILDVFFCLGGGKEGGFQAGGEE